MADDPAVSERVLIIISELRKQGLIKTDIDFFRPLGIENSTTISLIISGNRKFPKKNYTELLKVWDVNPAYLYFGKEPIFNYSEPLHILPVQTNRGTEENLRVIERELIRVPIVVKRAQAGYALGYSDPEYIEAMPKIYVTKEFEEGNLIAFEVDGDSMDDGSKRSICDGDAVLAKELFRDMWKYKLHFERNLFVVVCDRGCMIKQIINHDIETGDITCHSFNPSYKDFTINMNDVYQLFYVRKIIDRAIRL